MNEIRFNSFEPKTSHVVAEETTKQEVVKKPLFFMGMFKKISKIIFMIILVAAIVLLSVFVYRKFFSGLSIVNNTYSAVFLSNGQVYFGKMKENNSKEIILDNVFYLQSNNNQATSGQSIQGSQFTLVKLGNELHGPTDELFINKQNVLFYEYLRSDSQVVQSIKNYKQ